jgi:hypothetical protein
MVGAGATFVAEGVQHGIDPAFLVAIAGAETSFGQFLYSRDGDQSAYNAFNWFYGPTWPQSDFASWNDAIAAVAAGLAGPTYYGSGLYSVVAIAPVYCPVGTAAWIENVTAFLHEFGGNPGDTRLGHLPGPARLVLVDGVTLSPGPRLVGSELQATFTLTNVGSETGSWTTLALALRGPGNVSRDMGALSPLVLGPGESRTFVATRRLDLKGSWFGWVAVRSGSDWATVGTFPAFRFVTGSAPARPAAKPVRKPRHTSRRPSLGAGSTAEVLLTL